MRRGWRPKDFARQTVDDLQLPQECVALIAASLREQLKVAQQLQKFVERRDEPLLPRHVTLVVDATNEQKRFCDEFVWDTLDSSCDKPELLARRTCADMGLHAPFDAAVAFAIRRQLYRVALGFRPHENKASTQRDFPMPGRAEPHCWQARDPRDPRAQVPGPQPIGDPPAAHDGPPRLRVEVAREPRGQARRGPARARHLRRGGLGESAARDAGALRAGGAQGREVV